MQPSSRTPEGRPNRCPVCGKDLRIEPSQAPGEAPCPHCGNLLWFAASSAEALDPFVGRCDVSAATKSEAIERLVQELSNLGHLSSQLVPTIVDALLRREELGSTGIGRGVALPHVRHDAIQQLVGIVGHVRDGIDFESLDGDPVTRIFLLLSPANQPRAHLRALERVARLIRNTL